jgi:hypothetical protein
LIKTAFNPSLSISKVLSRPLFNSLILCWFISKPTVKYFLAN